MEDIIKLMKEGIILYPWTLVLTDNEYMVFYDIMQKTS